jgi:hypothetical protein
MFYGGVILVDNQFWIRVHAHVVQKCRWIPILLNLEKLTKGFGPENLINMLL